MAAEGAEMPMVSPPCAPRPSRAFVHSQRSKKAAAGGPPPPFDLHSRGGPGSIGLALKGGGNHATVAAFGVLRGFEAQQLQDGKSPLDVLDYIASNSGGGWSSLPFMFAGFNRDAKAAAAQHTAKTVLLDIQLDGGRPTAQPYPSSITQAELDTLPHTSLGSTMTNNPGWDVLCPAIASTCFNPLVEPHRIWAHYIYQSYFKPLGIPRGKYFTSCEAEADEIVKTHPLLTKRDFIWPRGGPIPIAHFALIAPSSAFVDFTNRAIKTGDYLWDHNVPTRAGFKGGFLEPGDDPIGLVVAARDSAEGGGGVTTVPYSASTTQVGSGYEWQRQAGEEYVMLPRSRCPPAPPLTFPIRHVPPYAWVPPGPRCLGQYGRFSVELAAAASSMALEPAVGSGTGCLRRCMQAWLKTLALQFKADTTPRPPPAADPTFRDLEFGDGGTNDAHAILPLIQQQVENIISVMNPDPAKGYVPSSQAELVTCDGVTRYADIYHYSMSGTEPPGDSPDSRLDRWILAFGPPFASLFGWMSMEVKKDNEAGSIRNASQPLNAVFRHGRSRLLELMLSLNKLFLAGLPLVYTLRELEVLQNPFWGTTPYTCHLTVICYYLPDTFGQQVGGSTKNSVQFVPGPQGLPNSGRFASPYQHVPELKIAMENTRQKCIDWKRLHPYLDVSGYSPGQINLTAYLGTWMIDQAWDGLNVEGEQIFGGFAQMFQFKCSDDERRDFHRRG